MLATDAGGPRRTVPCPAFLAQIDHTTVDSTCIFESGRCLQGNCTPGANTATDLKRLYMELSGNPVPLKPFQCLLLTNANTLFINDGNGFWMDNLYIGVMQPRSQYGTSPAHFLATGIVGAPFKVISYFNPPMNIFLTNITVHGHGQEALSTRFLSLTPAFSRTLLLFQGPPQPFPAMLWNSVHHLAE